MDENGVQIMTQMLRADFGQSRMTAWAFQGGARWTGREREREKREEGRREREKEIEEEEWEQERKEWGERVQCKHMLHPQMEKRSPNAPFKHPSIAHTRITH